MISESEKTIYLVRHGQSEDNVAAVYQSTNSPLSDVGRQQAEHLAYRVSRVPFETLIASPVRRARETAEAIESVTGKDAELSELFVERVKPTSINGKEHGDPHADTIWREWNESLRTPGHRVEDGENYDDLVTRTEDALAFLENRPEQSLVVVTHGYFLRCLTARVMFGEVPAGENARHFHRATLVQNTGVTVFRYQTTSEDHPRWQLLTYNDHAHLAE